MEPLIHSNRLILRHFIVDDAKDLFYLNNDSEVLKYTGDIPFTNKQEALEFIEHYGAYQKTGIGRYSVIRKEDQEFLGWCGLKYHAQERTVDLGFRLYKKYWNQSYATESAKAVIDYAFNTLLYPRLVAHAHIDNHSSQRVLEKCNFQKIKHFDYDGMPAILYQFENPDYVLKEIQSEETWPVRCFIKKKLWVLRVLWKTHILILLDNRVDYVEWLCYQNSEKKVLQSYFLLKGNSSLKKKVELYSGLTLVL